MSGFVDDVPAALARHMTEARARCADDMNAAGAPAGSDTRASTGTAAAPDAAALAEAGLAALRRALDGDGDAVAADLLAADALITEACAEAATNGLPDTLAAGRFSALLEER